MFTTALPTLWLRCIVDQAAGGRLFRRCRRGVCHGVVVYYSVPTRLKSHVPPMKVPHRLYRVIFTGISILRHISEIPTKRLAFYLFCRWPHNHTTHNSRPLRGRRYSANNQRTHTHLELNTDRRRGSIGLNRSSFKEKETRGHTTCLLCDFCKDLNKFSDRLT